MTGAGRGIGRGLADALAAHGYEVVGCSRSARDGLPFQHHAVDITDDVRVRALIADVDQRLGRLDLLVNCAAVGHAALALMSPTDAMRDVLGTNLLGTMIVTRESVRIMVRQRAGRIVTIASIAAALEMEGTALYSASKAGLVAYARVVAKELAPFGITSNVVAPSIVETDMKRALGDKAIEATLARLTIRRLASIDDIANAVLFFASPASAYVTGQVLYLGLSA